MALKSDSEKLARALQLEVPETPSKATDDFIPRPLAPLNVLDCVLSLNRQYETFCRPRVQRFADAHPRVRTLSDLLSVIERYRTPLEFSINELNYRDARRAETLVGVTEHLLTAQRGYAGATEARRLRQWAKQVGPEDSYIVGVPGFGLAGFQYMRMLFGAETAKPDVHIRRFASRAVGRTVSDIEALTLLESASRSLGRRVSNVDYAIWLKSSAKSAGGD